jgi:EmrB/QacA subfamily drug resistance transporter
MSVVSRVMSRAQTLGRLEYTWAVAIVVSLGMLMSMMDSTIVNVAIPEMQHAFGANLHDVQWVTTIYMLTQAAVIPTASYFTATWGGRRAYLWTLSAFLLGSVLCGFAWNLLSLVVFRLVQWIGGGVLLPMVLLLLFEAFPHNERGKASSALGSVMMIAPTLGPFLGGYLVGSFGWQWAFFITVPLGIIALLLAYKVLKPMPGQAGRRFDTPGFITAAAGSALLLYTVPSLVSGELPPWNLLFLFSGLALLALFVGNERWITMRGLAPLVDIRRFLDRAFTLSALTQMLAFFAWFGVLFLVPVYLQTVHQETPLQAGIIQGSISLATLCVLPLGGWVTDHIGARTAVKIGLCLFAGAMVLLVTLNLNTPPWMVVGILLLLGGSSGFNGQIQVLALLRIKQEETQEITNASTLFTVLRAAAAPLGVATIASIVQARSQHYLPSLAAQGLSANVAQRASILLGMHDGFLITTLMAHLAAGVIWCVPRATSPRVPIDKRRKTNETHWRSANVSVVYQASMEAGPSRRFNGARKLYAVAPLSCKMPCYIGPDLMPCSEGR